MISIAENVEETARQAVHKAHGLRRPSGYLVSALLAGAYIAVGEVLLLTAVSPLVAAGSPWVRLVEGAVFPIALTLVMCTGAQLFTSNVLVMLVGAFTGRTGRRALVGTWALCLVGNLLGTLGLAAMAHASGVTAAPSARAMLHEMLRAKNALDGGQLFWRAVLCNLLVCLGVWMYFRMRGEVAKILVLWLPVLVFVAAGFEHCVADMALYALGLFEGFSTPGELVRNLVFTVPGNIVGGGLLVGGLNWYVGGAVRSG
ncbi:transporter [Streptomyces spiroverticillatus]|uniref:Transporter n=1 Tax=Streptomyces finlayi TaxID=67296 RepID=A0A918WXI2_9ACTN|nr:formate/nitrite transporter family protein [Streptomyces finlayi]GGZ91784.1 transporter [Streptomyces spiroverticillatus]GHC93538.1 transporter [Streptomyces finlayi]